MNEMKLQSGIFIIAAMITVLFCLLFSSDPTEQRVFMLGLAILLLGVPHGALDAHYARKIFGLRTLPQWTCFSILYLACAGLVVLTWKIAPTLFLAGFLSISVFHFSEDIDKRTGFLTRIIYCGSILILPFFRHAEEVTHLFAQIIPADQAESFRTFLEPLSTGWLVLGIMTTGISLYRNFLTGLIVLSLGLLAVIAPPLLAFTVYFCVMHSPRHILRTLSYDRFSVKRVGLQGVVIPTLFTWLVIFFWGWKSTFSLESLVLSVTFVSLAALTVPHMIILRISGRANHGSKSL